MTDRSSSVQVDSFILSTDRDHKGRFHGSQAMVEHEYRGWHYHIEHPKLTQMEIFAYLSTELSKMKAEKISVPYFNGGTEKVCIGVVEATPAELEYWRLEDATTVLWISGKTGSLHIEANKKLPYAKNILTKPVLVSLLKQYEAKQVKEGLL